MCDLTLKFLELRGKPVLTHTLELFLNLDGISEVVLVIAEEYRSQYANFATGKLRFASPGKERQVYWTFNQPLTGLTQH